ncbi:TetR/AcrR family transcriptional regulator [Nocardioides sp. NPDC127514]|uniref:TetR/AcrR family transcriptional regulator n=1 Tax=unclassified Nocardioides TaxID=2615069 RepID=UPI00332EAACE
MEPLDLRARTRLAVRADISNAAMTLFLEQGFAATTIDQIAETVGISRRSLFRYFTSKEDIAVANVTERGNAVLAALQARDTNEGPWEALRAAVFQAEGFGPTEVTDETLRISRLLRENPSLQGFRLEKQKQWQELLAPEIAKRLKDVEDPESAARGIVAAALACVDAAVDIWVARGGTGDVFELFENMVAAVRR